MKKSFLSSLLLSVLLLAGLSFSCSEHEPNFDAAAAERAGFTLADVQRAFETAYASVPSTRTDGGFDENRVLDPCGIDPAWESVSFCCGDSLMLADVPFVARYDYRVLRWDEDGFPSLSALPGWLVVAKDSATGLTGSWLFFLIPDADAASGFSGTALYATLSGQPVSVGKFVGGTLVAEASLFDDARTAEENAGLLAGLLPDTHVARLRKQPATRATADTAIYKNIDIETVEVVGHAPIKTPGPGGAPVYTKPIGDGHGSSAPPLILTMNHLFRGDSEGGFSSDSDGEVPYPHNPCIKADKEIRPILDSIYMDCMGQLLINAIKTNVPIVREPDRSGCGVETTTTNFPNGVQVISHRILTGPKVTSVMLMEELMHIYQGAGTPAFKEAKLNKEIEAKLTWYIYMKNNDIKISTDKAFGDIQGDMCFSLMRECILSNDWDDDVFRLFYEGAAESLRTIRAYRNEVAYPFDPNNMDFSCLLQLLEDCKDK
ncbi:MAG: hypothetical protein K2L04_01910 [Alistipes sp.]|nr:hypothetical protein [Alistipes sp.]